MVNSIRDELRRTAIALICFSLVVPSIAEATMQFAVSPSRINLTLKPGEKGHKDIKIINMSEAKITIAASTMDFVRDERGNIQRLTPEEAEKFGGCGSWISFSKSLLLVPPGQTSNVSITARVPADAKPGTYSTYLIFGTPEAKVRPDTVKVIGQIASLLRVTVPGQRVEFPKMQKQGRLITFEVPRWNLGRSVTFKTKFKNTGNIHLDVEQNIEIRDKNGKVVARLKPIKKMILPGKTETLSNETLSNTFRGIPVFGKFEVVVTIEAGLDKPLVRRAEFWVIPGKLIAVGLSIILLLAIFLTALRIKGR
ncbi:MAG: hypothetical protein QMD66_06275 [Actinomycetota bacterium]|nr:hypothetical protein [Actinomycetota bacterium]